jgi:hypothetical protein
MGPHLAKYGFTTDYTRWMYHSEADRVREEVVRPRVDDYDDEGRVGDMLNDYHEAHFSKGCTEEEPRQAQRRITTCCPQHRNPFTAEQGFLNWMALDA